MCIYCCANNIHATLQRCLMKTGLLKKFVLLTKGGANI